MRKAWFCYEMGAKGPTVAIYYDDPPNEKNRLNRTVLQKHDVSHFTLALGDEVSASFAELTANYPYTGNHYDLEPVEPVAIAAE